MVRFQQPADASGDPFSNARDELEEIGDVSSLHEDSFDLFAGDDVAAVRAGRLNSGNSGGD